MKCYVCGTESDFAASFIRQSRSFSSTNQTLCHACWTRRRNSFEGWYLVAALVWGMIEYVLLWQDPWSAVGRFLTSLFLVDLFLILNIVPHELGHAVVGRLAGWRVFSVTVGAGKQFVKFRMFGIIFSFQSVALPGWTLWIPAHRAIILPHQCFVCSFKLWSRLNAP